ncbi:hypothetical protein [Alienimonas sp. DA493]|uniref:hypothetical protein n=1 Tax=Alienimonas sp. DA493 TaxID=3373605 RepID=UPI003754C616
MIRFALFAGAAALTAAPAFAGSYGSSCSSCGNAAPTYAAPSYGYSAPANRCGSTGYVTRTSHAYSAPSSSCGTPCGQSYAAPTSAYGQSYAAPSYASSSCSPCATSTCGSATVAYSQPSYGVVQTSGTCNSCSGAATSSYATPCGQSYGASYGQPVYGQPSYGQPVYGAPAVSNCPNCATGTQVDGTTNFAQPLQQGGVIQPQPLNTTTQPNAPVRNAAPVQNAPNVDVDVNDAGSSNSVVPDATIDAGPATEAPETPGDISGDDA